VDEVIQQVAQNAALLAYEDRNGDLVLAALGAVTAASGVTYGENVQSFDIETAIDQRYSEIVCCSQGTDSWGELSGSDFFDTEKDPNVPRHRPLHIVLDRVAEKPEDFTINKAKWEIARRAGRGTIVRATVDSWRDSSGTLWTPNTLVPVDLPGLRLADNMLCLSEVTFRRDNESGTTADLLLLPKFAFLPEPISLQPLNAADVV
jgi:prophage tail gpP-like protein